MTDAEKIAELEAKLSTLQAAYDDHECYCEYCDESDESDDLPAAESVTEWLERQKVLGLISVEGRATVERLLEDLS